MRIVRNLLKMVWFQLTKAMVTKSSTTGKEMALNVSWRVNLFGLLASFLAAAGLVWTWK